MRRLAMVLAVAASGCAFHVTMTHQLKAPIKCELMGGMKVRCAHEKPEQELQPPSGQNIPPL